MIKVAIVDDHRLVRKSFAALIGAFKGISVIMEAEDGSALLNQLSSKTVDIVLLDLQMPGMDGYETCKHLNIKYPGVKILVVSQVTSKEGVQKAIQMGAHGYFSKNGDASNLEAALKIIHQSGFYFEPEMSMVLHGLIVRERIAATVIDPLKNLSEREVGVIRFFCEGYGASEIAVKMSITARTVEAYRKKILDKTEAVNFTTVVLMAIKFGYVETEAILSKKLTYFYQG